MTENNEMFKKNTERNGVDMYAGITYNKNAIKLFGEYTKLNEIDKI